MFTRCYMFICFVDVDTTQVLEYVWKKCAEENEKYEYKEYAR